MKLYFIFLLFLFFISANSKAEKISFHMECPKSVTENCKELDFKGKSKTIFVRNDSEMELFPESLLAAEIIEGNYVPDITSLRLTMSDSASKTFARITEKNKCDVNKLGSLNACLRLAIVFKEIVLLAPVVQEKIAGGAIIISNIKEQDPIMNITWMQELIQRTKVNIAKDNQEKMQNNSNKILLYFFLSLILIVSFLVYAFWGKKRPNK